MSITLPDLEIIEALDFDYEPPCESAYHGSDPRHSGAAYALLSIVRDCCGKHPSETYRCKKWTMYAMNGGLLRCGWCGVERVGGVSIIALVGYDS